MECGGEEKFGCKSIDYKGDGLDVWSVVQVGSGGRPGMITDDSETYVSIQFLWKNRCLWVKMYKKYLQKKNLK
jgi:hypothetical protein